MSSEKVVDELKIEIVMLKEEIAKLRGSKETIQDDPEHILNITPEEPDYMLLDDISSILKYCQRLEKDLMKAREDEYSISVSQHKHKIIFRISRY